MSDFSKNFLRERIGDDQRPREFFGVFGKHPGWDDHIEDLPLPTVSMATAKQLLYVQGIGSQISSGAWARLPEEARLPGFDHAFLWVRGPQFLAGRIWASSDGKRRTHFPMIALVQGINLPVEAALSSILEQLEPIVAGCQAARSAAEVRALISEAPRTVDAALEAPACTLRVWREAAQTMAEGFRKAGASARRLPADAGDPARSLRFWSHVGTAMAPPEAPLLFLAPLGEPWVDVLSGEPPPEQFFCLRAKPPALPLTCAAPAGDALEEIDADELIKSIDGRESAAGERSWISRFLRH